ncbi:MAG: DsbA family protein [Rhodospirillaceae bacterium]
MVHSFIRIAALLALLLPFIAAADATAQNKAVAPASPLQVSADQKAAFEQVIRDYLLAHPEVVVEAIQVYRQRTEQAEQERAKKALAAHAGALSNDPDSPVAGNPKGDVTIVEFFDYRCGYCKRVLPTIQEVLNTDKNVNLVFKEFPILGEDSLFASKAAIAAHMIDPKKYVGLHNALMQTTGALSEKRVMQVLQSQGYDAKAVRKKMDSEEVQAHIQKNYALAESLDIRGTPAFVIGKELVPGAVDTDQMRQLIKKARKG